MNSCVYQSIERIINITSMANKWLRWCEQNLPNQAVYVPSIFQMRDAFSHVISMLGQGIVEQGLGEEENPTKQFDEVAFFASDIVRDHLVEITDHTLRAYFDTADYIVESLGELSKAPAQTSVQSEDRYITLRGALTRFDKRISDLRAQKSNPPETAYAVVEDWDALLQVLTGIYSFANYEQIINQKYREAYALALDIEQRFSESAIQAYDEDFYKEKVELIKLKDAPDEYKKFISQDMHFEILEDPSSWQKKVIAAFQQKIDRLTDMRIHYEQLLAAMPSTDLIRRARSGAVAVHKFGCFVGSSILSAIITAIIGQYLFINSEATNAVVSNSQFITKLCGLFIILEILIYGLIMLGIKVFFCVMKKRLNQKDPSSVA